jgi:hypothetical protein
MSTRGSSTNAAIVVNAKVAALALVMFVCGLASGFILLQYSITNIEGNASQEALDMFGQHFWGGTNWTEAAIVVVNAGEKDALLHKITMLGMEMSWSNIYYWKTDSGPVSGDLNSTSGKLSGISFRIVVDGTKRDFQRATNELTLQTYWTIVLYVRNPGDVKPEDVPQKVTIALFTQNRMYYKEADSEVTSTPIGTEYLAITKVQWVWSATPANRQFKITVNNTGTKDVTINQILVNYAGVTGTISPTLPHILTTSQSVVLTVNYAYTNGTNYDISVATSSGYKYTNTFQGGTNSG